MRHRHHPDVVWDNDDDRVIAAAPSVGQVVILDGTAALIWDVLDGATTEEIVRDVSEATGAPTAEIEADVAAYLKDLAARALTVNSDD
ncbi:PqqD family protein [Tessaracoccus sp. G1721]